MAAELRPNINRPIDRDAVRPLALPDLMEGGRLGRLDELPNRQRRHSALGMLTRSSSRLGTRQRPRPEI